MAAAATVGDTGLGTGKQKRPQNRYKCGKSVRKSMTGPDRRQGSKECIEQPTERREDPKPGQTVTERINPHREPERQQITFESYAVTHKLEERSSAMSSP